MRSAVHEVIDLLVWQTCRDCYRSDDTIAGFASVSSNGASSVINLEVSNYMIPYTLPAVAADAVTSSLSVMTRTASMRKPLFASNRCLRSKLFTNSRVAFPIAPAMLLASTFIVRPSEPTFRSSYFNVTLYVFKVISLNVVICGLGLSIQSNVLLGWVQRAGWRALGSSRVRV